MYLGVRSQLTRDTLVERGRAHWRGLSAWLGLRRTLGSNQVFDRYVLVLYGRLKERAGSKDRDGAEAVKRSLGRSLCTAVALGLVALAGGLEPPGALAVPGHSFDAGLSLEGGCLGEDGIPDPGCPGGQHPPKSFDDSCGAAVDRNGDIYVASAAPANGSGKGGRIDVFGPKGEYLSEIPDEHQPCDLAVDSEGNVYVAEYQGKNAVLFEPESYPPQAGEKYTAPQVIFEHQEPGCREAWSVAVDPSNDHLYVGLYCEIREYGSAAEGSPLLREGLGDSLPILAAIDVYGENHNLYVTSAVPGSKEGDPANARLYVLDPEGKKIECEAGGFSFFFGNSGVGVDQANGDAYVDDMTGNHVVKQFNANCEAIGQLPSPPGLVQPRPFAGIAVSDPCLVGSEPCNPSAPYESPNEGYVFVGAGAEAHQSHLYAYAPKVEEPPEVDAQEVSGVSEGEARLEAKVNPQGSDTRYHFEYVAQAEFEESGYAGSVSTPEEDAGAAGSFGTVSVAISGLVPDTAYRFRVVASNCASREVETGCLTNGEGVPGGEGADASFVTYPIPPRQECPNAALRTGPSASLPDCRAYELVTPAQTNGRIPTMSELGNTNRDGFDTDLASPDGESLTFGLDGGSLASEEGGGFHDTYVARRGEDGWTSEFSGLRGSETTEAYPGGISPDNRYSFWFADDEGAHSLVEGNYLHGPGGQVEPIGMGSLGSDLDATGNLISAGGTHVIFVSYKHLEPQAAENPPGEELTATIYDRSVGGETKVVSLLPEDITPVAGSHVEFLGASPDGGAVAFKVNETLYLRRGGETQEVATGSTVFGGLSSDGGRLIYLVPNGTPKGIDPPHGDIFSYDAVNGETEAVGGGGESILVNVSLDGSHVFFVSPKPGVPGAYELYVWDASTEAISFIATVTERDVFGEKVPDVLETMTDGLGLWTNRALNPVRHTTEGPGADPSRATASGTTFLFESRTSLTHYANEGHAEIYRYSEEDGLSCLSCNPSGVPARFDARLQGPNALFLRSLPPVNSLARLANLSADGQTAFFQSGDPLVSTDNDGKVDVYEWEAEGRGGCARASGCLSLISSPHSSSDDYLYAVPPDGRNVFIETADPLSRADPDGGYSVYDARVEGGFAEGMPAPGPCQGADACRSPSPLPVLPNAVAGPFAGQNAGPPRRQHCAKGKKARTHGAKAHCPKHHRHNHGRRAR